jgi:hypothetical protein
MSTTYTRVLVGVGAIALTGLMTACGGGGGSSSAPTTGSTTTKPDTTTPIKPGTTTPPVTTKPPTTTPPPVGTKPPVAKPPASVVIIVHNGFWGYYTGLVFCDFGNNYCESGRAYGITTGGLYYNGIYYTSGPVSTGTTSGGVVSSGGMISGGTTSGGTTSGGTVSSGGPVSGGTTSGGTTSGGTTSGGYSSGGTSSGGYSSGGTTSSGDGIDQDTTDVNLQRGMAENAELDSRAQVMATQFQMDFEGARQLTQLADKMQILEQSGEMSDDDRAALARSALAVAGVEEDEVNDAAAKAAQGDISAVNTVMTKAATNLGMPSTAMLRDQILPSLGIVVPQ